MTVCANKRCKVLLFSVKLRQRICYRPLADRVMTSKYWPRPIHPTRLLNLIKDETYAEGDWSECRGSSTGIKVASSPKHFM